MQIQSYLSLDGRCEEAIEFYKSAIGAKVQFMMRFKDNPEPPAPGMQTAGMENKILHATLQIGDSVVMASDGRCRGQANFSGFCLSLSVANEAEADRCFNALAVGGKIQMPLAKTFFSSRFGMVNDKFGIPWMVIVPQHMPA